MTRFEDRSEAGKLLAAKLRKYKDIPGVVLAIPRGGVPVAYEVAKELGLPLELVLIKKIGHPSNKEYAIGAASLTDYFLIPHEGVSQEYVEDELGRIRERLKTMYSKFMGDKLPVDLKGKTVIVIDDGIATGNTLLATIQVLKKSKPLKVIIAVPVTSREALRKISNEVDEVVALMVPGSFQGVGAFYENFDQVSDQEVLFYLDKLRKFHKVSSQDS